MTVCAVKRVSRQSTRGSERTEERHASVQSLPRPRPLAPAQRGIGFLLDLESWGLSSSESLRDAAGGGLSPLSARRRRIPLCQKMLADARLPALILKFDEDLAAQVGTAGCADCGRLDFARYPQPIRFHDLR